MHDPKNLKLREFLKSVPIGPHVHEALVGISNTFADVGALEAKYGLERAPKRPFLLGLSVDDIRQGRIVSGSNQKGKAREQRMGILKASQFTLWDSKKSNRLALKLGDYLARLLDMCPKWEANMIQMDMLIQVRVEESIRDLRNLSKAAKQQSDRNRQEMQGSAGYDLVAATAAFKASVKETTVAEPPACNEHNFGDRRWCFNDGEATAAICSRTEIIHYVEWKYYRDQNSRDDAEAEKDILDLARFLCAEGRPPQFRVLPCLGVLKDPNNGRYAILYQPPPYLEDFSDKKTRPQGSITNQRTPVPLLQLIEQTAGAKGVLDLGIRFSIARKLIESIYILHATGWVHKNIRSKSIIFLPDESASPDISPIKTGNLDFSRPYLFGFRNARPEDPPSEDPQYREGYKRAPSGPPVDNYEAMYDSYPNEVVSMREQSIKLDIYHHPAKRENRKIRYRPSFDIYSLGCVLLELGLWKPLQSFDPLNSSTALEFQARLIALTDVELKGQAGGIYAGAVRACLEFEEGERGDTEVAQQLCWKVAGDLERCMA
ncbi:MAG: hypothetical protein M1839_008866 [Geoglossum umbratile]|nr:MAG: hypothetical protein M1839_008866 [Geoglossum umbratile]